MNLQYRYTKLKYNGHLTLITAHNVPNWFEKVFLRRKKELVQFIGKCTVWTERDALGNNVPVSNAVAKRLQAIEAGVTLDHKEAAKRGQTMKSKGVH